MASTSDRVLQVIPILIFIAVILVVRNEKEIVEFLEPYRKPPPHPEWLEIQEVKTMSVDGEYSSDKEFTLRSHPAEAIRILRAESSARERAKIRPVEVVNPEHECAMDLVMFGKHSKAYDDCVIAKGFLNSNAKE